MKFIRDMTCNVLMSPGAAAEDETIDHPRVETREGLEVATGGRGIVTAGTEEDPGPGTDTGGPAAETDTGGPDPETGETEEGVGAGTGGIEAIGGTGGTEPVRVAIETAGIEEAP